MAEMLVTAGLGSVGKKFLVQTLVNKGKRELAEKVAKYLGGTEIKEVIGKGIGKGVAKKVEYGTTKTIGGKILKEGVETVAQAAVMPHTWVGVENDKLETILNGDEYDFLDFMRSFTDAVQETFTERTGGKMIEKGLSKVLPFEKMWNHRIAGRTVSNDIIQSPFAETGEEYLGAIMDFIRSYNPLYSDQSNSEKRAGADEMFTGEGFAVTAGSVLPMSIFGGVSNSVKIHNTASKFRSAKSDLTNYLQQEGVIESDCRNIIRGIESSDNGIDFVNKCNIVYSQLDAQWLQQHPDASLEEAKQHQKELSAIIKNYLSKAIAYDESVQDINLRYSKLTDEERAVINDLFSKSLQKQTPSEASVEQDVQSPEPNSASESSVSIPEGDDVSAVVSIKNTDGSVSVLQIQSFDGFEYDADGAIDLRATAEKHTASITINGEQMTLKDALSSNLISSESEAMTTKSYYDQQRAVAEQANKAEAQQRAAAEQAQQAEAAAPQIDEVPIGTNEQVFATTLEDGVVEMGESRDEQGNIVYFKSEGKANDAINKLKKKSFFSNYDFELVPVQVGTRGTGVYAEPVNVYKIAAKARQETSEVVEPEVNNEESSSSPVEETSVAYWRGEPVEMIGEAELDGRVYMRVRLGNGKEKLVTKDNLFDSGGVQLYPKEKKQKPVDYLKGIGSREADISGISEQLLSKYGAEIAEEVVRDSYAESIDKRDNAKGALQRGDARIEAENWKLVGRAMGIELGEDLEERNKNNNFVEEKENDNGIRTTIRANRPTVRNMEEGRGAQNNLLELAKGRIARRSSSPDTESQRGIRVEDERQRAYADRERQETDVEAWAKSIGIWHEDATNELESLYGEKIGNGAESYVYLKDKNTVVKARDITGYNSLSEAIQSIELHNKLFPETAMTITGFGRSDGEFTIILDQKYVEGSRFATKEEIAHYIREQFGGVPDETVLGGNSYRNNEYLIQDLKPQNVIVGSNGDLYVIDGDFYPINQKEFSEPITANTPQSDVYEDDVTSLLPKEDADNYRAAVLSSDIETLNGFYIRALNGADKTKSELDAKRAELDEAVDIIDKVLINKDLKKLEKRLINERALYTGLNNKIQEIKKQIHNGEAAVEVAPQTTHSDVRVSEPEATTLSDLQDFGRLTAAHYSEERESRYNRMAAELGEPPLKGESSFKSSYTEEKSEPVKPTTTTYYEPKNAFFPEEKAVSSGNSSLSVLDNALDNEDTSGVRMAKKSKDNKRSGDRVYVVYDISEGVPRGYEPIDSDCEIAYRDNETAGVFSRVGDKTVLLDTSGKLVTGSLELYTDNEGVALGKSRIRSNANKLLNADTVQASLDKQLVIGKDAQGNFIRVSISDLLTKDYEIDDEYRDAVKTELMKSVGIINSTLRRNGFDTLLDSDFSTRGKHTNTAVRQNASKRKRNSDIISAIKSSGDIEFSMGNGMLTGANELSSEEADIEREARANGTWLKAPNGAATKLTPKQWLQVRTKAFKKWFGDWEKVAKINFEDANIKEIITIFEQQKNRYYERNNERTNRTVQGGNNQGTDELWGVGERRSSDDGQRTRREYQNILERRSDPSRIGGDSDNVEYINKVNDELEIALTNSDIPHTKQRLRKATAQEFHDAIAAEKIRNPKGWMVDVHDVADYENDHCYLTEDGKSGIAVTQDGDIISLFSSVSKDHRMEKLVPFAIAMGGRKGDCYGGGLQNLYARFGAKAVSQTPFNAEYAPDDWVGRKPNATEEDKEGFPIVGMLYPLSAQDCIYNYNKDSRVDLSQVQNFDDYDEMLENRDAVLSYINGVSKVVDENGEPLVVYHGSPLGNITVFDHKKGGEKSGLKENGTYFTTSKFLAEVYKNNRSLSEEQLLQINTEIARLEDELGNTRNNRDYDRINSEIEILKSAKEGRVYETFLNIRNPKEFNAEHSDGWDGWHKLQQDVGYDIKKGAEAIEAIFGLNKEARGVPNYDGIIAHDIADVHAANADVIPSNFFGDVFLVNNPSQIKSATDNVGTFDSENPDIRFSFVGEQVAANLDKAELDRIKAELDHIKEQAIADGTFMKAPNGKPTKLNEKQWLQVRTKAFKKWFGDWELAAKEVEGKHLLDCSKVVDENGEPLVVYHGSDWNPLAEKQGYAVFSKTDVEKGGHWFTDNKLMAESYGKNTTGCFLNIRNIETWNAGGKRWKEIEYKQPIAYKRATIVSQNYVLIYYYDKDGKFIGTKADYSASKIKKIGEHGLSNEIGRDENRDKCDALKAIQEQIGKITLSNKIHLENNGNEIKTISLRGLGYNERNEVDVLLYVFDENGNYCGNGNVIDYRDDLTLNELLSIKSVQEQYETDLFFRQKINRLIDMVNDYKSEFLQTEDVSNKGLSYVQILNTRNIVWIALEKNGRDGCLIRDVADWGWGKPSKKKPLGNVFVAFNSSQIKSATDNVGTFDSENPDIRFSNDSDVSDTGMVESEVTRSVIEEARRSGVEVVEVSDEEVSEALQQSGIEPLTDTVNSVYGYAKDGKIYLTKRGLNPNTPLHEYTHLWVKMMQSANPKEWSNIVELLKGSPVWESVVNDKDYADIRTDDNKVASEVLSRLSGTHNSQRLMDEMRSAIESAKERGDIMDAVGRHNVLMRIKEALNKFWQWVGTDLFHIKFNSIEEVTDRVLYDFVSDGGTKLENKEKELTLQQSQTKSLQESKESSNFTEQNNDDYGRNNEGNDREIQRGNNQRTREFKRNTEKRRDDNGIVQERWLNSSLLERRSDPSRIGGDSDNVIYINQVNDELEEALTSKGILHTKQRVRKATAAEFHDAIAAEKIRNPKGWMVDVHDVADYENDHCYLTEDGKSGIAVTSNGDMISLFSSVSGDHRMEKLIPFAITMGGTKGDCYGGGLEKLYARFGARPISQTPFNAEYAPSDWVGRNENATEKEKEGYPIIGMIYPKSAQECVDRFDRDVDVDMSLVREFTGENGYGDMIDYRDDVLSKELEDESSSRVGGLEFFISRKGEELDEALSIPNADERLSEAGKLYAELKNAFVQDVVDSNVYLHDLVEELNSVRKNEGAEMIPLSANPYEKASNVMSSAGGKLSIYHSDYYKPMINEVRINIDALYLGSKQKSVG